MAICNAKMPNETKKCLLCQAAAADDNKNRQLTRVARYIVVTVLVVAVAVAAVVTDNLMWHIKRQRQMAAATAHRGLPYRVGQRIPLEKG